MARSKSRTTHKLNKQAMMMSILFIAIMLSFVAVFSPLFKVPLIGNVSLWRIDIISSCVYLVGTFVAIWWASKSRLQLVWQTALIQIFSFSIIWIESLVKESQQGQIAATVQKASSPITNLTADLFLNFSSWRWGLVILIASFVMFIFVSIASRK